MQNTTNLTTIKRKRNIAGALVVFGFLLIIPGFVIDSMWLVGFAASLATICSFVLPHYIVKKMKLEEKILGKKIDKETENL